LKWASTTPGLLEPDSLTASSGRNFAFLQALSHDFGARYSKRRIKDANSYAMDKEFKPVVKSTMHHYNIHRAELSRDAHINELLAKVEDLKSVLGRNLDLLLHRDDQLGTLMVKSEKARRDSMVFRKQAQKVKNHTMMVSYKIW
jgi:Synaptobrevin